MIELAVLVGTVFVPFVVSFALARRPSIPLRWAGAIGTVGLPLLFWVGLVGLAALFVAPVYVCSAILGDLLGRNTRPKLT